MTLFIIFLTFFSGGKLENMHTFDSVQISINCDKHIYKGKDIIIEIVIKNKSPKPFLVPEQLYFGWGDDPDVDLTFEVQKLFKGSMISIEPYGDYNNRNFAENGKKYLSLENSSSKKYNVALNIFFHMKKGSYRAKAKFIAPQTNKIIFSDWIYFRVI